MRFLKLLPGLSLITFSGCIPFHPNTSLSLQVNQPVETAQNDNSLKEEIATFRAKEKIQIEKLKNLLNEEFNSEEGTDNPLLDENIP